MSTDNPEIEEMSRDELFKEFKQRLSLFEARVIAIKTMEDTEKRLQKERESMAIDYEINADMPEEYKKEEEHNQLLDKVDWIEKVRELNENHKLFADKLVTIRRLVADCIDIQEDTAEIIDCLDLEGK
jgi:hypothetical protein